MIPGTNILRWLLRLLGAGLLIFVVLPLIALILLSWFKVSIPLDSFREEIETATSSILGRKLSFGTSSEINLGLRPRIKFNEIVLENPASWNAGSHPSFATLQSLEIELGLIPLLKREISLHKVAVDGLILSVVETEGGDVNWKFELNLPEASPRSFRFTEPQRLSCRNISILESSPEEAPLNASFESIEIDATHADHVTLDLAGRFQKLSIRGELNGGALRDLIERPERWPYQFRGQIDDFNLLLESKPSEDSSQPELRHQFSLDAPNSDLIEILTGPLPELGVINLSGEWKYGGKLIELDELICSFGSINLNGRIQVDLTQTPPVLESDLHIQSFDTDLILAIKKKREEAMESNPAVIPERAEYPPDVRMPFVGDFKISATEVLTNDTTIRDLELAIEVQPKSIHAGISFELEGAPMEGTVSMERDKDAVDPFRIKVEFGSRDAELSGIARLYTGSPGFSGKADQLRFEVEGEGSNLSEALIKRHTNVYVEEAQMIYRVEEKEFPFYLEEGFADAGYMRETQMGISGIFREEEFTIAFNRLAPNKADTANSPYVDFTGDAAGATWKISGPIRRSEEEDYPALKIDISGESLGRLSNWITVNEAADLPFQVTGSVHRGEGWMLEIVHGELGESGVTGRIGVQEKGESLAMSAHLSFDRLDLSEAVEVIPEDAFSGIDFDTEVFPTNLHLNDLDATIEIEQLVLLNGDVGSLKFEAIARDGWIKSSKLEGLMGDAVLSGTSSFDFRSAQPEAILALDSAKVEFGRLLDQVGVGMGLNLKAGTLEIDIHARGSTTRQILLDSDLAVSFADALWTNRRDTIMNAIAIRVADGTILKARQGDLSVTTEGDIDGIPFLLQLQSDAITATMTKAERFDLDLLVALAESRIQVKTEAGLPFHKESLRGSVSVSGDRLDEWDDLFGIDLPPAGPYSITAKAELGENRFSFTEVACLFGESDLSGSLQVDISEETPSIDFNISSNRFLLTDFSGTGWSPQDGLPGDASLANQLVDLDRELIKLLSRGLLGSFNANGRIRAKSIRTAEGFIAEGDARVALQNGRLKVSPANLRVPGGDIILHYEYQPKAHTFDLDMKLATKAFDYGVIARQKDPASDDIGTLDLDVHLRNRDSPKAQFSIANASGHMNFAVHPEEVDAEAFDYWGTNLLVTLLAGFDPKDKALINCISGDFPLVDGKLNADSLLIDTTRVRVTAEGNVDFNDHTLDLVLTPKPKRPQFFSIGTRVGVSGGFDDYELDFGPLPVTRAALYFIGNTIAYPINLVIQKRLPEDGSDVCKEH